ncbi:pilus assembly protein TadG-related protein [Nocardioides sp. GXQ0305]|uniref:pilus assembly protein TadG-related protein n=1 Tax=Nocardioides sp. GXQ0305 TaxID=3423912 RepID=UPI003D7D58F4
MGRRDQTGQMSLLIVGLAVVLMTAVAVVVDATAAFLQRQGLATVADGAALAGADAGSRNEADLYGDGLTGDRRLRLRQQVARAAVADHLEATGASAAYPGLRWTVTLADDGDSVVVRVSAPLDLPLTFPGAPETAPVSATASATVRLD